MTNEVNRNVQAEASESDRSRLKHPALKKARAIQPGQRTFSSRPVWGKFRSQDFTLLNGYCNPQRDCSQIIRHDLVTLWER